VRPEGVEPSAPALGGRSLPHTSAMEEGDGIEPLTGFSRHARFRGELEHLLTHLPFIILRMQSSSTAFFRGIEFVFQESLPTHVHSFHLRHSQENEARLETEDYLQQDEQT
jgi:hypothetical protein